MTKNEAIERMKTMRWEHATNPSPDRTAFDMAISALKERDKETLEKIKAIIDIPNTVIQEDVMKYKMICDVMKGDIDGKT